MPTPFDALKPLLGRALETALNRAVALDPDTREALAALEGRYVSLALDAPPLALEVGVHGGYLQVGPP
ncbi:MAG TPA: SCP2 domain-containing protein, partial [Pseudoxanthomonas sp.]|nr:SCP2 domain-containing protein [Pseudoxanthomonas sp.]